MLDEFCYIGIPFRYNNKFSFYKNIDQGRKALFAFYSQCKYLSVNCKTMLDLSETYRKYYMLFVWGFCKGNQVEKLHLDVCIQLLCVKKSTCNVMVYLELGRISVEYVYICLFCMIKYWFRLLSTRNSILKEAYTVLLSLTEANVYNVNWVSF